ncbi:hypothetical protein [Streptomyces albogriseolus]|uniref:hypothetical protein n=1 Tax=Streptomyces albogriseolus TaxID=1887 RepID=UPI002250E8E3|nr:hypothetical protein [Streptomyces viridodiastaticus]MCX4622829.1 hypothetical protein [Streptomyces viridodiastaticus]
MITHVPPHHQGRRTCRALTGVGAGLTAVALLLTVSCTDSTPGPAGRVVGKEREFECHTERTGTDTKKQTRQVCGWEYELTTRDKDGRKHELEVPSYVYRSCRHGSAYPSCITR